MAKDHDEAPAIIADHAFEPRTKWWSLCRICGLARAAHQESTIDTRLSMFADQMERYGEIRHVDPAQRIELERELEREKRHHGGRARIGYYTDDFDDDDS